MRRKSRITSRASGMSPRPYVAASGGIFCDVTIHDFDLTRFMLGDEPVEVFATGSTLIDPTIGPEFDNCDSVMVVVRTADGKLCQVNNSRRATSATTSVWSSSAARARSSRTTAIAHALRRYGATATEMAEPYLNFFIQRYTEAFEAEIATFVAVIGDKTPIQATFDDGYRALVLA